MGRVAENCQRSLISHALCWSEQVTVKPHKQDLSVSQDLRVSCSVLFVSMRSHGLKPATLLCPWASPGKNTGVA